VSPQGRQLQVAGDLRRQVVLDGIEAGAAGSLPQMLVYPAGLSRRENHHHSAVDVGAGHGYAVVTGADGTFFHKR